MPNPFWSRRATSEWVVRQLRPQDLPVPEDDWEEQSHGRDLRGRESSPRQIQDGESRPRGSGETFRTPAVPGSWRGAGEQQEVRHVREGSRGRSRPEAAAKRTEGKIPEEVLQRAAGQGALNREVEKAMYQHLVDENEALRQELANIKATVSSGGSSWSEVRSESIAVPPPPPPPPATPERTPHGRKERYTPQGTQVPESPGGQEEEWIPPIPPIPPFPVLRGGEHRQGDQEELGGRAHLPGDGQGRHSSLGEATGQRGGRDLGVTHGWSRGAGMPSSAEAQMAKMAQEIQELQGLVNRQHRGSISDYWSMEVPRRAHPTPEDPKVHQQVMDELNGKGGSRRGWDDELRSFPVKLPALPDPQGQQATLLAGDWLTQVQPLMADVSSVAGPWWRRVVEATVQKYHMWLEAGPLDRLHVGPPQTHELPEGHDRLTQRVTNMLLEAIPDAMKAEAVATRQLTPQEILFRILKAYQPGGVAERSQVLQALTTTRPAAGAAEAVDMLRLWRRQLLRAQELGVARPDPVLLIRALDVVMRQLLLADSQSSFRVSAFRMEKRVDVQPTEAVVLTFHDLLLSEAELMVHETVAVVDAPESKGSEAPAVKAMGLETPPRRTASGGVCHWWGTEHGCRFGKMCQFNHGYLPDKAQRCWVCSATTHRRSECPYATTAGDGDPARVLGGSEGSGNGHQHQQGHHGNGQHGASPGQGSTGGKEKGKGGGKKGSPKGGKKGSKATGKGDATAAMMSKGGTLASGAGPKEEKPTVSKAEANENQGTGETEAASSLISEVTGLLKSLRVSNEGPKVKVCQVRRLSTEDRETVLLDGGATHCLKTATAREWKRGLPIQVQLASGTVGMRQDPETGFLLSEEKVQTIIPLSKMAESGYTVKWGRQGCEISHIKHGS